MLKITLKGVVGFDGVYEFRMDDLLHKDLHTIKTLSGVRAGELNEALAAGDHDLIVAFTTIALQKAGKPIHPELLWNAALGSIEVEDVPDDEEGDAEDPSSPTSNGPDSGGTSNVAPLRSGESTKSDSDIPQENSPPSTGSRGSETDAESA